MNFGLVNPSRMTAPRTARPRGIGAVHPHGLEHPGVTLAVALGELQRAGAQFTRLAADRVEVAVRRRHLHEPGAQRAGPGRRCAPARHRLPRGELGEHVAQWPVGEGHRA